MSQEEVMAIKELRDDKSRVTIVAKKGVAMAVLDKLNYLNKVKDLLADKHTY